MRARTHALCAPSAQPCGGTRASARGELPSARELFVVRRYFDEVWSRGQRDVLDQLLTADYVNHTPSTPNSAPGPAGLKPIVATFRSAFPDLRFEIEDMLVQGDRVAVRVSMEGHASWRALRSGRHSPPRESAADQHRAFPGRKRS